MMEDLKAKAVKEKNVEIVMFSKFQQFCKDVSAEKEGAIEDAKAQILQLTADIKKYDSDAKVLADEIAVLDGSISAAEQDKAEATAIRERPMRITWHWRR